LTLLQKIEKMRLRRGQGDDPQVEATMKSMETAYRMQTEAPQVFDIRKESQATLKLYGPGSTARGCLNRGASGGEGRADGAGLLRQGRPVGCARRHHGAQGEREELRPAVCGGDQGSEARGLWKDTLVVCGSEFGRTPVREVGGGGGQVKKGRDHNPFGFTMWLAGGA
jgi:hypothetical protein